MPKNNVTNKAKSKIVKDYSYDYSFEYVTDNGLAKLRTYLGKVAKGQSKVYTAPFSKGDSMATILSDWDKCLKSISDKWPTLYQFESDLAKKVGPMSVQLPLSERLGDVGHYYEDILLPSAPIDDRAVQAVVSEWGHSRGLRVRSQNKTVNLMKLSTNSGTPLFNSKRRDVIQETIPSSVTSTHGLWLNTNGLVTRAAAVLGWRGQEGGPHEEDVKQRVVWMFPFGVNVLELQVYQPLIEAAQRSNIVPAWVSMDEVDAAVTRLFDTKGAADLIVCTDFSRFDQHFNSDMQNCARSILTQLLTPDEPSKRWLRNVFPVKYEISIILGCDDEGQDLIVRHGKHGMASGSGGTNADETLVHRALQYEVAQSHNSRLNPNSMCLGDDGILTYPGITVEDVVDAYTSHGQECNLDKQYASTQDCVYLRRWHHIDYRVDGVCAGVYSTNRALGRLRYLERFMDPEYWSEELVALRQLSIIENCRFHPLFHEFIEFCMKRDKFRLGLDIPGFMDNLTVKAIEATDHIKDFLGYTKTLQGEGPDGISNWEVVKYLKSKR